MTWKGSQITYGAPRSAEVYVQEDMTAEAVRPVPTVRFATMKLQIGQLATIKEELMFVVRLSSLVVFSSNTLQQFCHTDHAYVFDMSAHCSIM